MPQPRPAPLIATSMIGGLVLLACSGLSGCGALRPAPKGELLRSRASAAELGWGDEISLDTFEVKDVERGGEVVREGRGSLFDEQSDRLRGEVLSRFRIDTEGVPAWQGVCRFGAYGDEESASVEQVCRLSPADADRPELSLVLAAPMHVSLAGLFMRGSEILAEIQGTLRLPLPPRWPRTTGATLTLQ